MAKTIWKYELPSDGRTIKIYEHIVEVLHIDAQGGVPMLWAIVDLDRKRDGYTEIVAWGTGWPLDEIYCETDYWGSCEDGYGYIWHYFAVSRFPDYCVADKKTVLGVINDTCRRVFHGRFKDGYVVCIDLYISLDQAVCDECTASLLFDYERALDVKPRELCFFV